MTPYFIENNGSVGSGPYRGRGGSSNALKYKTELCRSFQLYGICT
jgi:hypothetical protein